MGYTVKVVSVFIALLRKVLSTMPTPPAAKVTSLAPSDF
jgi:hypothetical protein